MKFSHVTKLVASAAVLCGTLGISSAAQAHVGVYVAGMSGVAIDTTAVNATYTVAFAPGHGCSGPRTAANPDGAYETTSMEVFMPRAASGAFILPEVRVVHGLGYDATIKTVADPTNTALKRVNSIVFNNFRLQAVNGGYTARDQMMFTITVKLPTLAAVKAAGYTYASGDATKSGAKIYFPSMQYCDVTNQNVGVQAASSAKAGATDTVDPTCNDNDEIVTTLYDDWTTASNTPSLTIGTSTSSILEIAGNAPTKTAAAAETYCSKPGGFNPRDLPLAGKFSAALTGAKGAQKLSIAASAPILNAGRTYKVVTPKGTVLGSARVGSDGVVRATFAGSTVNRIKSGLELRLMWGKKVLAVDAA
jgi:hypothetical protein